MTVTAGPREGAARTERSSAMSLTYSDFLYTRNDYFDYDDDIVREERRRLPSDFRPIQETKVPLMQNEDPINQDYIIVAEFSELEGPIPLCTIPSDAADKTDIAVNDFVVHLMSTDYQVNTVGQFRICKDTQVMRKNVFPNVHVFMQYFTLYDLKARGFVRPFCFGYVTKDHVKLDKYLKFLATEFNKVTSVLEYCNREWFSSELNMYLKTLQKAKESFIKGCSTTSGSDAESGHSNNNESRKESQSDEYLDSESVTLAQIAHQYSEIHNIFVTVQNFKKDAHTSYMKNIISETTNFFQMNFDSSLASLLKKIKVNLDGSCGSPFSSCDIMDIPLVHPLRPKGEPLRPLTIMGQLGSVYLVGKLMQIYNSCKMDIIFAEMTEATLSFRQHFTNLGLNESPVKSTGSDGNCSISSSRSQDSSSAGKPEERSFGSGRRSISELSPFEIVQDNKEINNVSSLLLDSDKNELQHIIEMLHTPTPVIPDNKSGSYHTVSEEESDLNIPSSQSQADTATETDFGNSVADSIADNNNDSVTSSSKYGHESQLGAAGTSNTVTQLKVNSLSSFSSDEEISLTSSPTKSPFDASDEIITKEPWWIYAAQKLVRGAPGYGLANFFRRYHEIAHHVLYSILLCRPIIICGEEKWSRRIGRVITALIPLIPAIGGPGYNPEEQSSKKWWKLLRWHRGILVQSHIETYRLIGLCIPEKLEVYDLIPPRLLTLVTIVSAEKKSILGGPAYSGDWFQNFEKKMQKHFYNCDVSLLAYIGGIYTEIEGKVYMYRSLVEKYKSTATSGKTSNTGIYLLLKELNLRASDAEIVKYLGNLISDPSECVNIL